MRLRNTLLGVTVAVLVAANLYVHAQVQQAGATLIQLMPSLYGLTPISATAAVAAQTTLTIPAPAAGQYNYICFLHFSASQNGTSTANTNAVTTSTNFNSYAIKYSLAATANTNYDWIEGWGSAASGCVKSTSPG